MRQDIYWMFSDQIREMISTWAKEIGAYVDDLEFYMFPQSWGSTALGYGGIGGQAITGSHTIVCYDMNSGNVFMSYGGHFFKVDNPNQTFWEDVYKHRVKPKNLLGTYRRVD